MGVVNLTPDSFSDGGDHQTPDAACHHAHQLIKDGAAILDLGAESTRPHATPVPPTEERARLLPVLQALVAESPGADIGAHISVDTRNPETIIAAAKITPVIWNDVTALTHHPDSAAVAADLACPIILMHAGQHFQGMPSPPDNSDIVQQVCETLSTRVDVALAAGVKPEAICLDPGIGFGKGTEDNLRLLRHLDQLLVLGFPVLVGASRKRFIDALSPSPEAKRRLAGSLVAHLAAIAGGAQIIRTHDVFETRQAVAVHQALQAIS